MWGNNLNAESTTKKCKAISPALHFFNQLYINSHNMLYPAIF
jgi:hypothetical protein